MGSGFHFWHFHWNASQSSLPSDHTPPQRDLTTVFKVTVRPVQPSWPSCSYQSMPNAQGSWFSNTCNTLRKSKPTYVLGKVALFPPFLPLQCNSLNLFTSGTTQRNKPLDKKKLSTQIVNNSLKRSLELNLPICQYWARGMVLDIHEEKYHLLNHLRIFNSSKSNVEISMKMLSSRIAILEFHSDQNLQGRSRMYEKCFPEPNTPH